MSEAAATQYKIKNVGTGTYLDMKDGKKDGPVQGWAQASGDKNQLWEITLNHEKTRITLKNVASQSFAHVKTHNIHETVIGGASQTFDLLKKQDGNYRIKAQEDRAFSLASSTNGTLVKLEKPESTKQEWAFEPAL